MGTSSKIGDLREDRFRWWNVPLGTSSCGRKMLPREDKLHGRYISEGGRLLREDRILRG